MIAVSVNLSNKDYKYIVTFNDERNQKTVKTNADPPEGLMIAINDVQRAVRNYSHIDGFWTVTLQKLTFADTSNSKNKVNVMLDNTTSFPYRRQRLNFTVSIPGPHMTEPDDERDTLLDAIACLKEQLTGFISLFR